MNNAAYFVSVTTCAQNGRQEELHESSHIMFAIVQAFSEWARWWICEYGLFPFFSHLLAHCRCRTSNMRTTQIPRGIWNTSRSIIREPYPILHDFH